MTFRHCTLIGLAAACISISGCKRGFSFNDVDDTVDITYAGPTEDASWVIIKPNADGDFTLEKRIEPTDDELEYDDEALEGSFDNLSSGFLKFSIDSDLPDEISSSTIVGLQIADHAVILFPFEDGSEEFIYLVPNEETCPTSGSGNGLYIDRTGNASSSEVSTINSYSYSSSNEIITLDNGVALDSDFTSGLSETYYLYDDDCENSVTSTIDGDYYHGDNSSVMETSDSSYSRFISFTSRSISSISAFDSEDYVGFLHKFSEPSEYYYISASCVSGICTLREESDYTTITKTSDIYQITLVDEDRNTPKSGMITGTFTDLVNTDYADTQVACIINSSVDDDDDSTTTSMLLTCNAQAPDDNDEIIHFILTVDED